MLIHPFKIIKKFQVNNYNLNEFPFEDKKADSIEHPLLFDFFNRYIDISVSNNFENQYFFPIFLTTFDKIAIEQLENCYYFILANKELFQSKKLILIIIDIYESLGIDVINNFVSKVNEICKVYLIDGEFKREKNIFLEHYPTLHWVHHQLYPKINQIIELNANHRVFIFMNRIGRLHRIKTINEILENNLRNYGYISFTKDTTAYLDWYKKYPKVMSETFDILDFNDVLKTNPTQFIPLEYCKQSFLFLNSETFCHEGSLFFSEKTFKPFWLGMPFITIASPGILVYLKQLGFKTFSDWIDESYDEEVDEDKKIKIIVQELIKFSKMNPAQRLAIREEMKPILEHNKILVEELTLKTPDIINILECITEKTKIL
jgi:hypothetical protein